MKALCRTPCKGESFVGGYEEAFLWDMVNITLDLTYSYICAK